MRLSSHIEWKVATGFNVSALSSIQKLYMVMNRVREYNKRSWASINKTCGISWGTKPVEWADSLTVELNQFINSY